MLALKILSAIISLSKNLIKSKAMLNIIMLVIIVYRMKGLFTFNKLAQKSSLS